jgi:nucleoid DNA-binding protein
MTKIKKEKPPTLGKIELYRKVYAKLCASQTEKSVREVVETTIEEVIKALEKGNNVCIRGFVQFEHKVKKPREMHNFNRGKIKVGEKKYIKATVADKIIDRRK